MVEAKLEVKVVEAKLEHKHDWEKMVEEKQEAKVVEVKQEHNHDWEKMKFVCTSLSWVY